MNRPLFTRTAKIREVWQQRREENSSPDNGRQITAAKKTRFGTNYAKNSRKANPLNPVAGATMTILAITRQMMMMPTTRKTIPATTAMLAFWSRSSPSTGRP
jgi:hypothetical protein